MGSVFKDHPLHCQPMTDCCEFRFLVGADLLPSTGFNMTFLVKYAGGISNLNLQVGHGLTKKTMVFDCAPHIFN